MIAVSTIILLVTREAGVPSDIVNQPDSVLQHVNFGRVGDVLRQTVDIDIQLLPKTRKAFVSTKIDLADVLDKTVHTFTKDLEIDYNTMRICQIHMLWGLVWTVDQTQGQAHVQLHQVHQQWSIHRIVSR